MKANSLRALMLLGLLSMVGACSTQMVAVMDFDQRFDFAKVKAIAIQPIDRTNIQLIRFSDMQVSRLNDAIADELRSKGFEIVEQNADADAYLTWHLVTREKTDVRSYNSVSYYNCWRCGPSVSDVSVRQYTEGTLIVDIIDPARNQSVWRSTIESRLKSNPDPERSEERRREATSVLFAQFPPG